MLCQTSAASADYAIRESLTLSWLLGIPGPFSVIKEFHSIDEHIYSLTNYVKFYTCTSLGFSARSLHLRWIISRKTRIHLSFDGFWHYLLKHDTTLTWIATNGINGFKLLLERHPFKQLLAN